MLASRILRLDSIQIQKEKRAIRSVCRAARSLNAGSAIGIPAPTLMWECPWARREPEQRRVRVRVLVKHFEHHEGAAKLYGSAVHVPSLAFPPKIMSLV